MQTVHAGLLKRIHQSGRRVAALKLRLGVAIDPSQLPRTIDELRSLIDELEVAVGDLAEVLDEQAARKETAAAAQRRAETLFRIAPMPCIGIDQEGVILEINAVAARLLNVTPRHIVGRAFPTFLAGDRPSFLRALNGVLQTQSTTHWESTIRPRDKGPFPATIFVALDPPDRILLVLQVPNSTLLSQAALESLPRAGPPAES